MRLRLQWCSTCNTRVERIKLLFFLIQLNYQFCSLHLQSLKMTLNKRDSVSEHREPESSDAHEVEATEKKLKYPKSVFFIVSNEFCERFSYYGMRTILALYLRNKLSYSDDTATVVYHVFTMFAYFFPLLGAILADSLLGKFRTIFYLSIVYAAGQLLLSATAVPTFGIPVREFSILGLLLIALGTGGIKPCVAAFGGDQFVLPQQERYLTMFFSVFYFAINSGSLLSTFLTPELRNGVKCYGDKECYSLAFFVPAVLMVVSIVIFVLGRPMYKVKQPQGNVMLNVVKCMSYAISNKSSKKERDHWLDHADDKYDTKLIEDIKATLQVLKLFIPLPIFWALFDQQGSRWTFQATRMDGEIGSFLLKPDQMQVVNPLFIVIFIPIFETCIYPVMAKIRFIDTPLKKLTTGGFLAAVAFIVSALIEMKLEKTYPILPSDGLGQLRVFNPQGCDISGTIGGNEVFIGSYEMWAKTEIDATKYDHLDYNITFGGCNGETASDQIGKFKVQGKSAISYLLIPDEKAWSYMDAVNKSESGNPMVRGLVYYQNYNNNPIKLEVKGDDESAEFHINATKINTIFETLVPGTYDILLDGKPIEKYAFKLGGIYTILARVTATKKEAHVITVTEPNSVHMLWLIPQYIIITMAEVMFSVTGLEFAFTQAPVSMKSLLQASWLLTVAFGNLIVVIIAEVKFFDNQKNEFFLFAGLMIVDMCIFAVMAKFYKYVDAEETESDPGDLPLQDSQGRDNAAYGPHDEKL